jgi:NAD(P)-dependent dehydrogenase (short-subunit alcohol dehydrogenase family)
MAQRRVLARAKFAVEGFSEVLANEVKPFGIDVIIVEPGGFRTDWQGSSMRLHPAGPDYDQTVGEINRMREKTNGTANIGRCSARMRHGPWGRVSKIGQPISVLHVDSSLVSGGPTK